MSKIDKTQLIRTIGNALRTKRKNVLQEHEKQYVITRLRNLDMSIFRDKSPNMVITALIELINSELNKLPKVEAEGPIDVHEMLKREIGSEPETSLLEKRIEEKTTVDALLQKPYSLQRIFNPNALRRKAYIILDRKYQAAGSNNINEFKWLVSNISQSYDPRTTAVTTAPIKDIIKIRMFPFYFPNTNNTITGLHRLSVEIAEFNTQSYIIAALNRRYHFEFDTVRTGSASSKEPFIMNDIGNSNSEFEFHDPIMELQSMTLRFGNPGVVIDLDPDSLYGVVTAFGAQAVITFSQPHYLAVASFVTISGFTTSNIVSDADEIKLMNDTDGWEVVALTTYTVTINVDLSTLAGAIVSPTYVYLEGKRFSLRVELTYIVNN